MAGVCAVTGATGFLGRNLVRVLAAEGWRVRALARRDPVAAFGEAQAEVTIGGLDRAALAKLCRGAEVLVHVAGLVKAPNRRAFDAVNVEGARLAAEAARAAGARMVLVSSLAAREPQLSDYAASKHAGETAAAAVLGDKLSVVRPPAIYGPGDRETLTIFRFAARSPLLPVFDPRARIALIHVEDAARQIAAAAAFAPAKPCVALSDACPEGYSWREIVQAAACAVGSRGRAMRTPAGVLALAGLVGSLSQKFGARPILTLGKSRELRWPDWALGGEERWESAPPAKFTLNEGFGHTVGWWRASRVML